ncbi:MAG: helix-turn-helix transcriptional regulator [Actinomycetota bacterium]
MLRIERLINLIAALLDGRRPLTAAEIRERIAGYDSQTAEAFRRTFERDKAELRDMGIPIETVKDEDDNDAYVISAEKYYMPELDLQPDEIAALKLAADAILGVGELAGSGLKKLSIYASTEDASAPRVLWNADVAAEQPLLAPLLGALLGRHPIGFGYENATGERSSRKLEPYGLVHRRGHWYVVGRDVDREAARSFRVSRMLAPLTELPGSYEIPSDFDVDAHVPAEAWEIGEEETRIATVRFDADLRWWPEQNLPEAPRRENDDGTLDVDLPISRVDALVTWAVGFGEGIEIVAPPEARRALLDHLEPLLAGDG